ncbi:MAG: ABC transporter ATP-binding protein [Desulfamplus sp.]|nr:ABC transporter ATP-binding protein [Desulfamplus sp.]
MTLLNIVDLNISLPTTSGIVTASNGISLEIGQGETHCLIGESGCGKTIVALAIMRLLPVNAKISGKIFLNGVNLFSLSNKEMRQIRREQIAMIFEQPQSCLNPVFSVGSQIAEAVKIRDKCSAKASKEKALELMRNVQIPDSHKRYHHYPHEYSGGMAQRAMIAMAMALRPALLIADEPTTSLDVTIQAQIMELIKDLVVQFNTSLFLITHDLEAAFSMCGHVSIMYAGFIMEKGTVENIIKSPKHPYTKALLSTISSEYSSPVRGMPPELTKLPAGCVFHPRCSNAMPVCSKIDPQMEKGVRCHLTMKI